MHQSHLHFRPQRVLAGLMITGMLSVTAAHSMAEDDSPMWRRNTHGGPVAGEPTLVDPQMTEATRLWISEADIPPGRRGSGDDGRHRDGLVDMERPAAGGFGSPIAAAGKVFQYHYRPSGALYDAPRARGLGMSQEELQAQQPEMTGNLVRGHERWLISATDVITAMDAETGKTAWQTDLTDQGLNRAFFGKGGGGLTPAYHDGMLIAMASNAQIFGLDAETGEILWTYEGLWRHQQMVEYRRQAIEGDLFAPRFNRDMLFGLVAADGLVVINDMRWHRVQQRSGTTYHYDTMNSYVALDVRTGEERWTVPEVGSANSTPKLVTIDGKTYVLAVSIFHLTLIDLETGEQIWQSDEGHQSRTCDFNLGVSDQYVVMSARQRGVDGRRFNAYRIGLDGLHKLWTWGPIREWRSNALILGDVGYIHFQGNLRAFNMENGEVLAEVPIGDIRPAGGSPFLTSYGGWIFSRARGYGEEGLDGMFVFRADPSQLAESKRFFQMDTAQPYYCLIFPAFANSTLFMRTDFSNKMEAYRLR